MKSFKTILLLLITLVAGFYIILILIAPTKFRVERTIVIEQPLTEVRQYLQYYSNEKEWSQRAKLDPKLKVKITNDGSENAEYEWTTSDKLETGRKERISFEDKKIVDLMKLTHKRFSVKGDSYCFLEEIDSNQTKLIWGFMSITKEPFNVANYFYDWEDAIGQEFTYSLSNLKRELEK